MGSPALYTLVPYFAAAGFVFLFATLRSWRVHDRGIDKLLAIALILIAAMVAGSTDLGTDAPSYHSYFDGLLTSADLYSWWDPGFVWLAVPFARAGATYGLFAFTLVLGSHLIKLHVYDKVAPNSVLAFFVLFCFNFGEVAVVRQYLAASIIFLSFYLLTRQRIALAILSIFAATLIHKTALPVGIIVVLVNYGRSSLKPAALLGLVIALGALVLPRQAIQDRVLAQIAAYTVEGYVQGLQGEDISLWRNVGKFLVYVVLALWMVMLPSKTRSEEIQRKAAQVVFALSAVSVALIAISPVFSRFSIYVFPFLALTVRAERFAPDLKQLPEQTVVVVMLLANLGISAYPLLEYL